MTMEDERWLDDVTPINLERSGRDVCVFLFLFFLYFWGGKALGNQSRILTRLLPYRTNLASTDETQSHKKTRTSRIRINTTVRSQGRARNLRLTFVCWYCQ